MPARSRTPKVAPRERSGEKPREKTEWTHLKRVLMGKAVERLTPAEFSRDSIVLRRVVERVGTGGGAFQGDKALAKRNGRVQILSPVGFTPGGKTRPPREGRLVSEFKLPLARPVTDVRQQNAQVDRLNGAFRRADLWFLAVHAKSHIVVHTPEGRAALTRASFEKAATGETHSRYPWVKSTFQPRRTFNPNR